MYEVYLIVYDIHHPARLRKLAKIVQDYGIRMQKSIFEAKLLPSEFKNMMCRMQHIINPAEDGIKIFRLCQSCVSKRTGAGIEKPFLSDRGWHIS